MKIYTLVAGLERYLKMFDIFYFRVTLDIFWGRRAKLQPTYKSKSLESRD